MPAAHATFCLRLLMGILGLLAMPVLDAVDVLTFHNDNTHSGANTLETTLTQSNVNFGTFGLIAQIPVSGDVFAQPLYVSQATVTGNANPANLLIVATENDNVYCFDADNNVQYWEAQLGTPVPRSVVVTNGDTNYDINIGITSTPVIDKVNGFVYVCGLTRDASLNSHYTLWQLSLATGATLQSAPITYTPTPDTTPSSTFVPAKQGQRPALTLANGNVYIAFASFSDLMTYCGYVFSYSASTLAQVAVFRVCPAAYTSTGEDGGGIWMSGCGPAIDSHGNVYVVTGNGYSDPIGPPTSTNNYGEAIVKLDPNTLTVLDYFTPSIRNTVLNPEDADLGVGGLVLLPANPSGLNLVVHDSKQGLLYVENRDNLGEYVAPPGVDTIIQENNWFGGSLVKATPVYWTDSTGVLRVFAAAESANPITSFTVSPTGILVKNLTSKNLDNSTNVSLTQMALSCNGSTAGTGVLWLMSPTVGDPVHQFGPGILRAYNADTLHEIYNTTLYPSRDTIGYWPKNCAPLVANGKVYCASLTNYTSATANTIYVYGLLPATTGLSVQITSPANGFIAGLEPAAITITASGTSATTNVTKLTFFQGITQIGVVTNPTNGNLSGSVTMTPVYAGTYSFTVLVQDNTGATVLSSPVTVTVPSVGYGSIELETYYNTNLTSTNNTATLAALSADPYYPNSPGLGAGAPSTIPSNATAAITFPTSASGPYNDGISNYGDRLIGFVYPPITGTYYFWISSDDASVLYLSSDDTPANQVPIASVAAWCNNEVWNAYASQQSVPITLVAGQRYFIQAVHVQSGGGDNLNIAWQLPDGQLPVGLSGQLGTFEAPIAGGHLSPPTLAPLISPRSDSNGYSGPITVTLTSALPTSGESIYYTTGGTTPSTASTLYTGPFVVSGTETIKAVTVLTDTTSAAPVGTIVSPVATTTYTITGATPYGVASLPPVGGITVPVSLLANPPTLLSLTGVFSNWNAASLVPAAGILPYDVISPLWSDGATKNRWIALPAGGQIAFAPTGEFTYPAGTVMIKNFALNGLPLELRLLVLNGPNAGYGITYKWNSGGTDATLMGPGSPTGLQDGLNEVEASGQIWHYPSRAECLTCHTAAANFVLGPKTRQLNSTVAYPGGNSDNQLRTWNYLQMFTTDIGESNISGFTALANVSDTTQPLVNRARSYLDSNCAQCHRYGGVDTNWDAVYDTPLAQQNIVNGLLVNTYGIIGAETVYPQVPSASMIYLRMNILGITPPVQMPPMDRNVIDTNAVGVLASWINSLPANQPTITAIAPSSGPVGTVVNLTGSAFTGTNLVTINGIQATSFTVTADTGMTVTMPSGATTGPIIITSCGLTATSTPFTVIPPPTVTSVAPPSGPVGTVVTISGSAFTGATAVAFNGTTASAFSVTSDTQISATVAVGTTTGAISVTTPIGTGMGSSFTVIPPPTVTTVLPASGPIGAVVTITGLNFTAATAVSFHGAAAITFTVSSDTQISATVPAGATTGAISVTTPSGTGTGSSFTVIPAPTVTSVAPTSGPIGAVVTITGINFTGATAVAFHGTAAITFTVSTDTQITATVPVGASTGAISVTTPSGTGTGSSFAVIPAPTITSVAPSSGPIGTVVTITGTSLSGTTIVAFHGTPATTVSVTSGTQIIATVPVGATTGAISVTTPNGTGVGSLFTVIPAPTVSTVVPSSGPIGAAVTITGINFTGATMVSFHGTAAITFTVSSDTQISATVPAGATTGAISVTTPSGTGTGSSFAVIPAPTVTTVAPSSGPIGAVVSITGLNFTGATAVSFHGTAAITFTVNSDTQISATVPAGATSGAISVTTPSGTGTGSSFAVIPAPTITSVAPSSGPIGTGVTITGLNFTGATAVAFHGTAASVFSATSDTQITATVPVGATTGAISVTTPIGTGMGSSFTVIPPPTVISVAPSSGPIGAEVTITGLNFTGATAVSFHGTAAITFSVSSDTQITATVPAGASTGAISVTTPSGTGTGSSFAVIPAPTVTTVAPSSGPIGAVVTITGVNFTGATGVAFNSVAAITFTVSSDTQISATVPAGATTGAISVTTPSGTGTGSSFAVIPAPTITSVAPSSGPIGTVVAITGINLSGATAVAFNGTAAITFTVSSGTQIIATVPVGATTGAISVTTPVGTGTGSSFAVIPAPTITSVVPSSGPINTVVTITGTNLSGATAVAFNGTAAITFTVNSGSQITATVPVGATTGAISVTTPGGSGTGSSFAVIPAPTITSVAPSSGPIGTVVTITGTNLSGATAVAFNGTAAITFTVNTSSQITATVPVGATTGAISVTTPSGTDAGSSFTVIPAPTITSVTPSNGPIGTMVRITGTNLSGVTAVEFHGTAAITVTVTSDTQITATVPVGATTGAVAVTTPGGTVSGNVFTVTGTAAGEASSTAAPASSAGGGGCGLGTAGAGLLLMLWSMRRQLRR